MDLIRENFPVARKDHRCMASDFLQEELYEAIERATFSEKRDIVKARRNLWQVKKGEKYTSQFIVCGGDCWSFKGITAIHKICLRLELYPDI